MTTILLYITLLFGYNADVQAEVKKEDPVISTLGSAGGGCPGGRTCDKDDG
ncbi:hypothetical protein [Aliikangiella marina]|uniref:hypothetical protein n=1 Tax=Aliikangiella marina TaxID=1712262 RepID=UPI00163DE594|nr:hypothetical protein [Aliikangiella marina]